MDNPPEKRVRSYYEFMREKSGSLVTDYFKRELDRQIRAKEYNQYVSSDTYHIFLQEVMELLPEIDQIDDDTVDKIYQFADLVLADMGAQTGYNHTFLRHVKHVSEGGSYQGPVEQSMNKIFNKSGIMTHSVSQFLSCEKDGRLTLNSWGELMLERMDEQQILSVYNAPDAANITQLYCLSDTPARD